MQIDLFAIDGRNVVSGDYTSLREAIESARDLRMVDLTGANLRGAKLRGVDLSGARLADAVLAGADLRGAKLRGVDLSDADLSDADLSAADLRGANLRNANLRYAVLRRADMRRADCYRADLSSADISGADIFGADFSEANLNVSVGLHDVPIVPDIDRRILAALGKGGELCMPWWHTCETTHCRAGWAIHLAGKAGYDLEEAVGPSAAAALIYQKSAGYVPDFYADENSALKDIEAHA